MFILITGGSGSGKSEFAESQILKWSKEKRIYLATMKCFDEESKKRIERHRKMRAAKQFETVECYLNIGQAEIPEGASVLLECMSNLMDGILALKKKAKNLCVVTNEVFSDGEQYDPDTMQYLSYLGKVNCEMAKLADEVYEVVYGIPLKRKGENKK